MGDEGLLFTQKQNGHKSHREMWWMSDLHFKLSVEATAQSVSTS